jgi:NADH-quinone oxidoreductase subunit L
MKWTYWTMVIGGLSLAGIFPLSGFWSKDEILATAFERESGIGWLVLLLGLLAAVMTAFYMFRAIFLTFHGEYRGGAEAEAADAETAGESEPVGLGHTHLHESPWVMVGPLVVLATLAIFAGYLANPLGDLGPVKKHAFATFVVERNDAVFVHEAEDEPEFGVAEVHLPDAVHSGAEPEFSVPIAVISLALGGAGIALAYAMYLSGIISPVDVGRRFRPVYTLFFRKYYIDELYEDRLVVRGFYQRLVRVTAWFDIAWIDNVNVQLSRITANLGRGLSNVQNGQAQTYAAVMAVGFLVVLFAFLVWGA